MKINQILDKIDDNLLFVPAFQREYVWKRADAKNLIASLIRKYPTGTMLTWETNKPPELKGTWKYDSMQGGVKIILDGQQRITTLYMLIKGEIPPYYTEKEIMNDPRGLYVNIRNLEMEYYIKNKMENNPYWINITDIFQKKTRGQDIIRQLEENGDKVEREDEDIIFDNFKAIDSIPDEEFVEQVIPVKASLKEAINIFYIVNASGVNLTDAELALAQISGYWPQAREEFKNKLKDLEEQGFVFNLDFIIYCLLGILHNKGSEMVKLHSEDNNENLKAAWKKLNEEVLDYVVNILKTHAYIDHTKEINSKYAIVPIVVYVFNKEKSTLSQEEINKVVKWFYYSQIRQRYVSQLPQKLDKDIGVVVKSKQPFDELLNILSKERKLEIDPDEFIGVGIRNALFSLMRWYFKSRKAICFTTGVGIRQNNMGKKYSLEWDHIFPYSLLTKDGYGMNNRHKYSLAQEITNRAILTQVANRRKSNKTAEEYLENVKKEFPQALKLQSIPEDSNLWKQENFENFLSERRKMLASELNSFLQNITITEEAVSEVPLDEIIKEGESNELEFKSSLRWSYKAGVMDKKLESVILKTLAAFGNSEGGILIIGVNDDGEAIGLDRDYRSLNGNKDEFEIHLRNIFSESFGKAFVSSNVNVSFPVVNKNEICKIEITNSKSPLYVKLPNNNGQKEEKFYVRSGNTSQELSLSEVPGYISSNFK